MQFPQRFLNAALLALSLSAAPLSANQAIANWDLVPGQRIDTIFEVGVVAFHETGVDVEFRVNGGDPITVADPTWNNRTGVYEYWFELDPADYPDGPVVLSATAIPEGAGHQARVLDDVTLYANSGGTVGSNQVLWVAPNGSDSSGNGSEGAPFATIKKAVTTIGDGGTIYLKAGNYILENMNGGSFTYWTTVAAPPG